MATQRDKLAEELAISVLSKDSRIDISEISVSVVDGVLYLRGQVDSAAEKNAALEDMQVVASLVRVVDEIELKNYTERSDDELRESVKMFLIRDIDLSAQTIDVEARGGVITLTGKVASFAQKSEAENVAWWIPGVTNVISRLEGDGVLDPSRESDY